MVKKVLICILLAVAFVISVITPMPWYNKILSMLVLGVGFIVMLTTDVSKKDEENKG